MSEKEYLLFFDESDRLGQYYSNFYGGLIVGASQYEILTHEAKELKHELHFFGETKWEKVTEQYLQKYEALIHWFFQQVAAKRLKVRIMFRQNANRPRNIKREQLEMQYFLLYYQFVKNAFGLEQIGPTTPGTRLRFYFDEFPETGEKIARFKGFLLGLGKNKKWQDARIILLPENITEVRSRDHELMQCLDIVLGAMSFRLNDKHKKIMPGKRIRGKRTRSKEKLYRMILGEIRTIKPGFNIGVSTRFPRGGRGKWDEPYLHWRFRSEDSKFMPQLTKRGRSRGLT